MHHSRRRQSFAVLAVVGSLLLGVLPAGVSAANPPDRTLRGPARHGTSLPRVPAAQAPDRIIVRYGPGTTKAAHATLRAQERLTHLRDLDLIRAEVVEPRGRSVAATLAALRARPDVISAEQVVTRVPLVDPTAEPYFGQQWGLHNTGQVVNGVAGTANIDIDGLEALAQTGGDPNLVVAVIDDGVDFTHPDLTGAEWVNPGEVAGNGIDDDGNGYVDDVNGWDFCNDDNTVHDVGNDWHGTAVAGTIAARINGQGIAGVAPNVKIMALKFLDEANRFCGTDEQVVAAIEYAASFGVRIANASYGGYTYSSAEKAAIDASGLLLVAAAGNDGMDIDQSPTYPAAYTSPNILTVASIDNTGHYSWFSNVGRTSVDLAAPGEDVLVAIAATSSTAAAWAFENGTSFSAPHVTGVAALAATARPALLSNPIALRDRVVSTAWGQSGYYTATGGVADALYAIDAPTITAPSGVLLAPATLGTSTVTTRVSTAAGTDDDGPIAKYQLEQRVNGASWTKVANPAGAYATNRSLTIATTYEYRLIAWDKAGNSVYMSGPKLRPLKYEDSNSNLRYGGTWYTSSSSTASGGKTKYSKRAGNSVTFRFTGRGIAYAAPKSASRGSVRIYIDGVYSKLVSLYSSTSRARQVVYAKSWSSSATHTIKLVVVGTAGHPRVDVDAFVVLR